MVEIRCPLCKSNNVKFVKIPPPDDENLCQKRAISLAGWACQECGDTSGFFDTPGKIQSALKERGWFTEVEE